MGSKVYFLDVRALRGKSWLTEVERLVARSGVDKIISPGDMVAIKVHFGERGTTAYVAPPYIRRIADRVKEKGGKAFLTDTNTLYVGSRMNAVEHLITALENGFSFATVGVPLIIADGLTGRDFVPVEISGKHFKEVKIASAIYHADCILAVSHFKGHEATGFGGALKNVGMGTGSRAGKQMMHSDVLPKVTGEKCRGCQKCLRWCPAQAIEIVDGKASINPDLCLGCGECTVTCPHEAIKIRWRTTPESLQEKIVEFAWGALKDKKEKCAFINFVTGVTPFCDCTGWSDYPLVGDIGILASRDPVAVDQASYDLVLKESGLPGSRLGDKIGEADKFKAVHNIDGTIQLKYAEEIGLGSREYDLILV